MNDFFPEIIEPPYVPDHWFWGQREAWRRAPTNFPAELALAHNGIARYRVAHKRFVTIAKACYLREFMVQKQPRFTRGLFQKIMSQGLGQMLLTLDADNWKKRRKVMLPGFSRVNVNKLASSSLWSAERMCARWQELVAAGEQPNIVSETRFAAMESMFHMLFGEEPPAEQISELVEAGQHMGRQVTRRSQAPQALFLNKVPKMKACDQQARDRFDEVLRPFFSDFDDPGKATNGILLQAILQSAKANDLSAEETRKLLSEEVRGLFMAGYETTADTLAWLFYFISRDPKIAKRFREEVAGLDADHLVEHAAFDKLPFTERLIFETLRLAPSVPLVGRVAVEDESIGGFKIKKGTTVQASILGLHHNPEVWPDPMSFDPDRFVKNDPRLKNGNWVPFGYGPHVCVGAQVALNSLKIFLLIIGKEFSFAFEEDRPLEQKLDGVTAGPDRDFSLALKPLDDAEK